MAEVEEQEINYLRREKEVWDQGYEISDESELIQSSFDLDFEEELRKNHKKKVSEEEGDEVGNRVKKNGRDRRRKEENEMKKEFFNNPSNGQELILDIIMIIRHQQYLLDNIDHLDLYNECLLEVWKKQINLLDSYERFEHYKLLGKLKQLMKQFLLLESITIDSLLLYDQNQKILDDKDVLLQLLIKDLENVKMEIDFERAIFDMIAKTGRERYESVRFLRAKQEDYAKDTTSVKKCQVCSLLEFVHSFCLKILQYQQIQNLYRCSLCKQQFQHLEQLLQHCNESHLKFLSNILLGNKDKCFSLNCNIRKGKNQRINYNISDHLKWTHSQIYQEDCIFTKLYDQDGNKKAHNFFYGIDSKNWRKKFDRDLFDWLDRVDPGAKQYLIDLGDQGIMRQKRKGFLYGLRTWMENDQSLMNSEVEAAFGDFDQLSYLLKWSWSSNLAQNRDVQELRWIYEKLTPEPKRILLIEAIADLMDTKQSLIAQLHRYLYLGVFNFKLTQKELKFRIAYLENQIRDLGIFQSVLFNPDCTSEQCLFEGVLCSNKYKFETHQQMYEHYWDFHVGMMYALSSPQLQGNLEKRKKHTRQEQQYNRRAIVNDHNIFSDLKFNEIIHYLHDYHEADIKTRSKKFLRMCIQNFQLKSVCFECQRELNEFGEVYWHEQIGLVKKKKPKLVLRHYQTVQQVIEVYKWNRGETKQMKEEVETKEEEEEEEEGIGNQFKINLGQIAEEQQQMSSWSELKVIDDQCQLFKLEVFEQMKSEVLIDDKGRLSQCKDCYKKLKSFNPLLKELKEEYFTLPTKLEEQERLEIKKSDPCFIRIQKKVLNRMIEEKGGGWRSLKEEMESGYFRIHSFPKLVWIYGEISEKKNQNPRRILSQPILKGYMKVLFQSPLIYIRDSNIIYEMKPEWNKQGENLFKLFGSSDLQRKELIQILESHPIMQNHSYQLTKLTKLCVDQVDLMFQLNKQLLKQSKQKSEKNEQRQHNTEQEQNEGVEIKEKYDRGEKVEEDVCQDNIASELTNTADLLYFESVLHRAQACFLIQQFRIWIEVFENVINGIEKYLYDNLRKGERDIKDSILENLKNELEKFSSLKRSDNNHNQENEINTNYKNGRNLMDLFLMIILAMFYLKGANKQMKLSSLKIEREITSESSFLDFILSEHKSNSIRFIVECHVLPIVIPLVEQFVHPIFVGTLIQIFQLHLKRRGWRGIEDKSIKFYLNYVYEGLSILTIKRCLPLFDFFQKEQKNKKKKEIDQIEEIQQQKSECQFEEQDELKENNWERRRRREKLESEDRWFQLRLFKKLNEQQVADMQCRYALSKRSLIKAMNSEIEDPLIECDLRWAMQIAFMFYNFIKNRAGGQGSEEEKRVAEQHVNELSRLKKETDDYFNKNRTSIPDDFLFKKFKKNGVEYTSDLRSLIEEFMKQDQMKGLNQSSNLNNYKLIHNLKIAYFIPMEKKLQDIVGCISKIRSLPHRQVYRSFEKFSKYNFRELEMLAYPELYATGQGFQQFLAPKLERSEIVIDIIQEERQKAQDVLKNLKQYKKEVKTNQKQLNEKCLSGIQACMDQNAISNSNIDTFKFQVTLEDFTAQYRQGQYLPIPKQAILSLNQEDHIKNSLSSSYVYNMQKASVIKVFQEASESASIKERGFKLEQEIEINISGDELLTESLKEQHVLKNFKDILKKQQHWSNECQTFIKNLKDEVENRRNQLQSYQQVNKIRIEELDDQLLDYIRLQEKLFLDIKRKEISQQFQNIDLSDLEVLRQQHVIDLKSAQIKSSSKREGELKRSYEDAQEELHSEVLLSVNSTDEVAKQIQIKAATFSKQYTSIGEDTRFRLLNKQTRIFNSRHGFIFWRYTQRLLARIFSYYSVVNGFSFFEKQGSEKKKIFQHSFKVQDDKGENQLKMKEFENLPPIKGSNVYFKQKYKEQRAISFQKGTPYLFLTYALYEFDKKTYQVVQGLNQFDLEDENLLKKRQRRMDKNTYIKLTKSFAIYFHFISKNVTRCIMNTNVKFKSDSHLYKLYDYGMFGSCIGYTNRFEFQQRGSIHLHQLLYFQKNEKGEISEKLLEYWASIFSLWNLKEGNKREIKDCEFVRKFLLKHVCTTDNCIREEDGKCRKGYPWNISETSYWNGDYLNRIHPRVQNQEEQMIFMHDRDIVKCFNSSCIIEACGNEKIIDYITKYISKVNKTSIKEEKVKEVNEDALRKQSLIDNEKNGCTSELKQEEVTNQDQKNQNAWLKKKANQLVEKVIQNKITSLQEAYCDLLDYPLFQTSFTCIKIAQVPLQEQFQMNTKTLKWCYDADHPDFDLKSSMKQSIWFKYLSRPTELEDLTLYEYAMHFMWYGKKKKYQEKAQKLQKENVFFVDLNGQIIKQRERDIDVIINLSQVYYLEDLSYEPNLFYLAMLQLFWVHRQESWLKETSDTYDGFKQTYYKLYNQNSEVNARREYIQKKSKSNDSISNLIKKKLNFKEAVDEYKKLTPSQQKFLKRVNFVPFKKEKSELNKHQQCKQFFTYHALLRAKNSIIKLKGLLEQDDSHFIGSIEDVEKVVNYLRPDVLINGSQKQEILQLEVRIINFIKNQQKKEQKLISQTQKVIIEEIGSLLKSQGFSDLFSFINGTQSLIDFSPEKKHPTNNQFENFSLSTEFKISQREIEQFSNFSEDNIEFPQHFRSVLTKSELKPIKRLKIRMEEWESFVPSNYLQKIFEYDFNQEQKFAVFILLHYFYQSQVEMKKQELENEENGEIYEGCLVHGGGGVGKSFIIDFLISFFVELDVKYFVLCPTQVAVQNLLKEKHDFSRVMTIHSFFHLNESASIETSFNHFISFLRYVNKEHLYPSSTSLLYPELSFYNCMMKVDKFTEKLKGVRVIILEEISMIAPNFLSLLDIYLQVSQSCNLPFGGIQVFGFGDSFQLQPVTHPPTYFFESHIFSNSYFSSYLELTIPVRQVSDTEFYEQILQPIRIGQFQIHKNFQNSMRLLRMRHLSELTNNQTQYNLAQGLQEQVQRLQVDNKITFLYFENSEVIKENQLRANQHITAYQLKFQHHQQQEKFRIFINSPARLSFGIKSMKIDKLLMNLSDDYEITSELIQEITDQLSYAQHFKLLPLTIKNYLFQNLLPHVYERALQAQRISQSFPLSITLFKTAQIVFRKNLNKAQNMINGQAAVITDMQFDIDFKSENLLLQQSNEKREIIESSLIRNKLQRKQDIDGYLKFELSSQFRELSKRELELCDLNNINTLLNEDVMESEKAHLFSNGIQPRLQALKLQLQGKSNNILMDNLEQYFQKSTVSIKSDTIKGIVIQALDIINLLLKKIEQCDQSSSAILSIIEGFITGNKIALHLFGVSILQNSFDTHLLKRSRFHLIQLISNLNEEWTPMQISQLPINLAYARTIHTSQGATFDNVCVKLNSNHLNRPGLLYTAFSRVRNLQQLFLQGEFGVELFSNNVPQELKNFFDQNFTTVEQILNSNFFKDLIIHNHLNIEGVMQMLKQMNTIIRKNLLKQKLRCLEGKGEVLIA